MPRYWKANFVKELTDYAIVTHATYWPDAPSMSSTMHGAVHRVASDATAFAYGDANFATVIAGMWDDPARNGEDIAIKARTKGTTTGWWT